MHQKKRILLFVPVVTVLILMGLYGIEQVVPWKDETVYIQAAGSRTTSSDTGVSGGAVTGDAGADRTGSGGVESGSGAANTAAKSGAANTAAKSSSGTDQTASAKSVPATYTKMTLVVGQTGNLTERKKEKEPIYKEPDLNAEVAAYLEYNCAVLAKEQQSSYYSDSWVRVDLAGAGDGYVRKDAVWVVNAAFGSENSVYNGIIQDALSHIGARFKMNGDSLTTGIDCAHFARKMYQENGLNIPEKAKKIRNAGTVVRSQDKQPGDIIYYDKANNGSGHVGIYLGDGFVINSTGHSGKTYPEGGVRIVCLTYPDRTHYETLRFTKN